MGSDKVYIKSFVRDKDVAIVVLHDFFEFHEVNLGFVESIQEEINGCSVYLLDLPGHGLSSGQRNIVNKTTDIKNILYKIGEEHGKVILLGHGLGCFPLLELIERGEEESYKFSYILMNPCISLNHELKRNFKKTIMGHLVSNIRFSPHFQLSEIYGNDEIIKLLSHNPLSIQQFTFETIERILEQKTRLLKKIYYIKHRILFQITIDSKIIDIDDVKLFIKSIPSNNIEYKEYRSRKHNLINSNKSNQVVKDIVEWVSRV